MARKKEKGEDLTSRFRFILVGGLLIWGLFYTLAYAQQESRLSELQGELTGLKDELGRYIEWQNENHAYVVTLHITMAKAGLEVPAPPSLPQPEAPKKDPKNGS